MKILKLSLLTVALMPVITVNATEIFREEFDNTTQGISSGITYVETPTGRGAHFTRGAESRIQYSYPSHSGTMPKSGTLKMRLRVDSAYQYRNYQVSTDESCALIFTTDVGGGDVTWPGSAWLYVCKNGDVSMTIATTKYGSQPSQVLVAKGTSFNFGTWHTVGFSFGTGGQAIEIDGKVVASNPKNTQLLGAGGDHYSQIDTPTLGESKPGFWANNQYDGGFEGVVDAFIISDVSKDWAWDSNTNAIPVPTVFPPVTDTACNSTAFTAIPCIMKVKIGWDLAPKLMNYWYAGSGKTVYISSDTIRNIAPSDFGAITVTEAIDFLKDPALFDITVIDKNKKPIPGFYKRGLERELANTKNSNGKLVLANGGSFTHIADEFNYFRYNPYYNDKTLEQKSLHFIAEKTVVSSDVNEEYTAAIGSAAFRLVTKGYVAIDKITKVKTIVITGGAVYLRDKYDFIGKQGLGCWSLSWPYVVPGWCINNSDFRNYNIKKNRDESRGNFLIISQPEEFTYQTTYPTWVFGQ